MKTYSGTLRYDTERGVIYFFDDESNECLLRIEGVKNVPGGHQIDIHLIKKGDEHHHETCGNRSKFLDVPVDPGMFCAVKLEEKQ